MTKHDTIQAQSADDSSSLSPHTGSTLCIFGNVAGGISLHWTTEQIKYVGDNAKRIKVRS